MEHSILIADSGSTKTAWALLMPDGKSQTFTGKGINPFMLSQKELEALLRKEVCPQVEICSTTIENVFFYGAGCRGGEESKVVTDALKNTLRVENVSVYSDLLGAAHALWGRTSGIACILGTGSASCYYDGKQIVKNVPSLGYILGDEGSGAIIGKALVNELFKGTLPSEIHDSFLQVCPKGIEDVLRRVYKEPFANRFLASLVGTVVAPHRDRPEIQALLKNEFKKFFDRNIRHYGKPSLPIGFVGGLAFHFEEELRAVAAEEGYRVAQILKNPLEGLFSMYMEGTLK